MLDMIEDIKKSPEYIAANTELNKIKKNFNAAIESFENGAISEEKYTNTLWKLQSELNTTYYAHASIYRVVNTLSKKYNRLHNEIYNAISLSSIKGDLL